MKNQIPTLCLDRFYLLANLSGYCFLILQHSCMHSIVCYSNGIVKFESFMHMEWSEEKFLKGIVVDKTRLRF